MSSSLKPLLNILDLSSTRIRIGLLLNDTKVPSWTAEVINFLKRDTRFEICFVAVNQFASEKRSDYVGYKILRKIDEYLMPLKDTPFKRIEISLVGIDEIKVMPLQKKYSDYFPLEAIQKIKSCNSDFIIRFGFRILRGEILNASKFGILSLHHGDVESYRGGPPAFWEVYHKFPVTGVSLQILTEKLDAGKLLSRCWLNTFPFSFHRNQHRIYLAGTKLLKDQLGQIASVGPEEYILQQTNLPVELSKGKLYKTPGNLQSIFILFWYLFQNGIRQIQKLFTRWQWQIAVSDFEMVGNNKKLLTHRRLTVPKDREWADPFIISEAGINYIFLEEKEFQKKNAHIAVVRVNNRGVLVDEKPITILSEPIHLSYPFVFKYRGEYFMLPESGDAGTLTLYKAETFPLIWKKEKILINHEMIYDPTLYEHDDGKWYLFCTAKQEKGYSSNAYLHIYYTADLLNDDFKPHPANPVYNDVRCSRPAGSVIKTKGKIIRPFQICAPAYGNGIGFAEIEHLSETCYKEKIINRFEDYQGIDFTKTHTFNSSGNLVVTDLLVKRSKW